MNSKIKSMLWTAGAVLLALTVDKALGVSSMLSSKVSS